MELTDILTAPQGVGWQLGIAIKMSGKKNYSGKTFYHERGAESNLKASCV